MQKCQCFILLIDILFKRWVVCFARQWLKLHDTHKVPFTFLNMDNLAASHHSLSPLLKIGKNKSATLQLALLAVFLKISELTACTDVPKPNFLDVCHSWLTHKDGGNAHGCLVAAARSHSPGTVLPAMATACV